MTQMPVAEPPLLEVDDLQTTFIVGEGQQVRAVDGVGFAVKAEDAERLLAVLAPDYQHHWGTTEEAISADDMIAQYGEFAAAFPNMQLTVHALVAEDDLVVGYWTVNVTQVSDFQGMPAVDMPISWSGFNLLRIACGMVAESWNESDHLGRLIQNGTITPEELSSVGTATP